MQELIEKIETIHYQSESEDLNNESLKYTKQVMMKQRLYD